MPAAVRGVAPLAHGDLTGARHRTRLEDKEDREKIIAQTVAEIRSGDDIALVSVPGGKTWAIPRQVIRYLGAK